MTDTIVCPTIIGEIQSGRSQPRYVVVDAPRQQLLQFRYASERRLYEIWTPWLIYIILCNNEFRSVYVEHLFATSTFPSDNTAVTSAPIPNVYPISGVWGRTCVGNSQCPPAASVTVPQICAHAMNLFWMSTFNGTDGISAELLRQFGRTEIRRIYSWNDVIPLWEKLSREEVLTLTDALVSHHSKTLDVTTAVLGTYKRYSEPIPMN